MLLRVTLNIIKGIIRLYRRTLSPDHGFLRVFFPHGVCRYTPTCSEYMEQAIIKCGWRGVGMGAKRIVRCHPLSAGGVDPVPDCANITKQQRI